jgi:hypothetical protein
LSGRPLGQGNPPAQAAPLAGVKTLAGYADWMKGMFTPFPNASYEVKAFAADTVRGNVTACGVLRQ